MATCVAGSLTSQMTSMLVKQPICCCSSAPSSASGLRMTPTAFTKLSGLQYSAPASAGSRGRRALGGGCRIRSHTEVATEVDRATCPPVKDQIDFGTFSSVDLRVGLITDAKPVADREMTEKRGQPTMSRKFLELQVDIGCETRTIVSECKYAMDVEDAVGKKVLFVANVPPTEVHGVKSHGLILTGLNYDPTPMPRSFKVTLPGLGRLPPGSQVLEAAIPR